MGFTTIVGKYRIGRTIGEGCFAKVKVALNTETRQSVAIKIIDKNMVMENQLMTQIKREISTMKLLNHPNIVQIYEVIATKTKIYIVMEYVSGGQLSEKLSYSDRLSEYEARKYFQQLIDVVDYCHGKGVYHRDLKPENLLLDSKGNLKVSDFGLSVYRKVIANKKYEGAAADVWSCGVILFELLAGYLPFDDRNLMNLYKKISKAEYACPKWFTAGQRRMLFNILDPLPKRRMTAAKIIGDEWFQINYEPFQGTDSKENINLDDVHAAFDCTTGSATEIEKSRSPSFINAFQLIAMSTDLDLSGFFEEQDEDKQKTRLGSRHPIGQTIEKIEDAAKDVCLSVERMNNSRVIIQHKSKLSGSRSNFNLSAEVIEVTPTNCVIDISKSVGDLTVYNEFCKSLSILLKDKSEASKLRMLPEVEIEAKGVQKTQEKQSSIETKQLNRGYSSS
ncbi:hypothetical protein GIB67_022587 [Kingdonia uniflora]|uniref:non-specific serine/threonine protein kinase n=1 Tax=Kingdonia uniflora TaxID=39325 RepID=A0A7J7L7I6_9MAGN|nr:hypothetical protein GIB67_022587 [Kingdonia uniflora]